MDPEHSYVGKFVYTRAVASVVVFVTSFYLPKTKYIYTSNNNSNSADNF